MYTSKVYCSTCSSFKLEAAQHYRTTKVTAAVAPVVVVVALAGAIVSAKMDAAKLQDLHACHGVQHIPSVTE